MEIGSPSSDEDGAPAPAPAPAPTPAPSPAPAPLLGAFGKMMAKQREKACEEARIKEYEAQQEALYGPKKKKGAGKPPTDCVWDDYRGYMVTEASRPSESHVRSHDLRSWVLPEGAPDDIFEEAAAAPPGKKRRRSDAHYLEEWKKILPFLIFVLGKGVDKSAATSASIAANTFKCPRDAGCTGCDQCGRMCCSRCMQRGTPGRTDGANPFVVGCSRFHIQSVRGHADVYHPELKFGQTDVTVMIENMVQKEKARLTALFRNVYWLTRSKIALKKFKSLCDLVSFYVPLGRMYVNKIMARDMLESLAHVIREDVNQMARKSPVLGLMVDESTDSSNTNLMVLYLRILASEGFKTVFWGIVKVTDATGRGLADVILQHFEESEIPTELLASMATDGASAMTSPDVGAAVLVAAAANGHMLPCHCVAHRHALASKDGAEDNELAEYFEGVLHDVVNYHSRSPKRAEHLSRLQSELKVAKLRLVRVVATRWLSRAAAVVRVWKVISALVLEFHADSRDRSNETATTLYQALFSYKFICALTLFMGVLSTLAQISTAFQRDHVVYRDVRMIIDAAKQSFRAIYNKETFVGTPEWMELIEAKETATAMMTDGPRLFEWRGVQKILVDETAEAAVKAGIADFAEKVVTALGERFPENTGSVMEALDVFNLDLVPKTREKLVEYGNSDIERLCAYYGASQTVKGKLFRRRVDPALVRVQWPLLRERLFDLKAKMDEAVDQGGAAPSFHDPSGVVFTKLDAYNEALRFCENFEDIKLLLCASLVLVISTVWCERGFSVMAEIKTKQRNQMTTLTLDDHMMSCLNGPDFADKEAVDRLIARALVHWKNKRKRMPQRSHPGRAGRPRKDARSKSLSDVLLDQARAARRRAQEAGHEVDSSDSDDEDDDSGHEEDEEELELLALDQQQLLEKYGAFGTPDGYKLLEKPAEDQTAWAEIAKKEKWWRGKRLAHIWETGWDTSTFKGKVARRAEDDGPEEYTFFYATDGMKYTHTLPLEEYGQTGTWVIMVKDTNARAAR